MTLNKKLIMQLFIVHIFIIAISNYLVQFSFEISNFYFTWSMFTFPIVILATDLTVRLSNKYNARAVIGLAYIPAVIVSIYLADWRIGLASGTAYLIGQLLDVFVFQKIRENTDTWWIAPAISTVFANIIDTYSFFGMSFANGTDEFMAENWIHIATTDLIFKIIVSVVLFLPLYGILLSYLQNKIK